MSEPASQTSIDRKFEIKAVSRTSRTVYTEENSILFLVRDTAFALTLPTYLENCKKVGADAGQIKAVELLIQRVERWRKANPDKIKVPDCNPVEEPDCVRPHPSDAH